MEIEKEVMNKKPRNSKLIEHLLNKVNSCSNFKEFIRENKTKLKEQDQAILAELITAYALKEICGFIVSFLPHKLDHGEVIINNKENSDYNQLKKPDLWITHKGKQFFVEVKYIEFSKNIALKTAYSSNFDFIKASSNLTKKIMGKVREAHEQISCWGQGYIAIYCGKGHIDLDLIKKSIIPLLSELQSIKGIILTYLEYNSSIDALKPICKVISSD